MRIKEIIEEKVHRAEIGERSVMIHENPRGLALANLLDKSAFKNLRGLVQGPNIYVWDANDGTHDDTARAFGLEAVPDDDPRRMLFYLQPDGSIFIDVAAQYRDHPRILSLLQSPYNRMVVEAKRTLD